MQRRSAQTGTGVDVPQRRSGECYCDSLHDWKQERGLAFSHCRQTVHAESSTVDGDGENIVPLLSSQASIETQLLSATISQLMAGQTQVWAAPVDLLCHCQ